MKTKLNLFLIGVMVTTALVCGFTSCDKEEVTIKGSTESITSEPMNTSNCRGVHVIHGGTAIIVVEHGCAATAGRGFGGVLGGPLPIYTGNEPFDDTAVFIDGMQFTITEVGNADNIYLTLYTDAYGVIADTQAIGDLNPGKYDVIVTADGYLPFIHEEVNFPLSNSERLWTFLEKEE